MALAFKREQKEVEEKFSEVEKRLADTLKTNVPLSADFDSIKGIDGEGEWYSGKPEPNKVLGLRYLKEQAALGIVMAVENVAKDEPGIEAVKCNIEKIMLNVTDKNNGSKVDMRDVKCFDVTVKDKTLFCTANLDFKQYVGQYFPYSEVGKVIETQLDKMENLKFKQQRIRCQGKIDEVYSRLKSTIDLAIEVDYDGILKQCTQESCPSHYNNPANSVAVEFVIEQQALGVVLALEDLCKDDLGKEATAETFKKVVLHVQPGATEKDDTRKIEFHACEAKGTELHITSTVCFDSYIHQYFPYSELSKKIEALLG